MQYITTTELRTKSSKVVSAAEAECDIFLTEDKKLLNLKFFGKTQIASINE